MSGRTGSTGDTNKGQPIRFVKGKYVGLTGWIDKSKKKKKDSFFRNVIVHLEPDDDDDDDEGNHRSLGEELSTRVKLSSYRKLWPAAAPRSFAEAAIMQHPDIERAMIELAEMFAQCCIQQTDPALNLLCVEIDLARKNLIKQGRKGRYRAVNFQQQSQAI